jgi:hypothetical protein
MFVSYLLPIINSSQSSLQPDSTDSTTVESNASQHPDGGLFSPVYSNDTRNNDLGKPDLYKTELCKSWEENIGCEYGAKCPFAHGENELRKVNTSSGYIVMISA